MNKTELIGLEENNQGFSCGDIFLDCDQEPYMLAKIGENWVTFSLTDGIYWDEGKTIEEAIEDLEFFGRNAKITIAR